MGCKIGSGILFVLGMPLFAAAQIVVTEIMYDLSEGGDTGREWVEVQNTGSENVNLVEWKLFENDTNHGLKAVGGDTLAPGAYAIISDNPAKFSTDWPSYAGLVFDSAFALNNSGETIILRCCGKEPSDRDSVTYNNTGGGSGDGLSLHRSGSSLVAAQPSPGSGAVTAPSPPTTEPDPEPEPTPVVQPKAPEPVVQTKQEIAPVQTAPQKETFETKIAPLATPIPASTVVVQDELPVAPKKQKKQKTIVPDMEEIAESEDEEVSEITQRPTPAGQVAAAQSAGSSSDMLWWLGAAAVSFFGAGAAYMAGRAQRKTGWKIEEME